MLVVIRVDSLRDIGAGCVRRCVNLAEWLRDFCAEITFTFRAMMQSLTDELKGRRLSVKQLNVDYSERGSMSDADAACAELASLSSIPGWLVLDYYSRGKEWEQSVRSYAKFRCALNFFWDVRRARVAVRRGTTVSNDLLD